MKVIYIFSISFLLLFLSCGREKTQSEKLISYNSEMTEIINSDEFRKAVSEGNAENLEKLLNTKKAKALESSGYNDFDDYIKSLKDMQKDSSAKIEFEKTEIDKLKSFYSLYIPYLLSTGFKNAYKEGKNVGEYREKMDKMLSQSCGFQDVKDFEAVAKKHLTNEEIKLLNDSLNSVSRRVMKEITEEIQKTN